MKSVSGKTSYEVWHGHKTEVSQLCVFGCVAHVKVTKPHLAKLYDRSTWMVLFGYEPGSAAYRVYDPTSNRVHISRDVVFNEGAQWDWENTSGTPNDAPFHIEYSHPISAATVQPDPTKDQVTGTSLVEHSHPDECRVEQSGEVQLEVDLDDHPIISTHPMTS